MNRLDATSLHTVDVLRPDGIESAVVYNHGVDMHDDVTVANLEINLESVRALFTDGVQRSRAIKQAFVSSKMGRTDQQRKQFVCPTLDRAEGLLRQLQAQQQSIEATDGEHHVPISMVLLGGSGLGKSTFGSRMMAPAGLPTNEAIPCCFAVGGGGEDVTLLQQTAVHGPHLDITVTLQWPSGAVRRYSISNNLAVPGDVVNPENEQVELLDRFRELRVLYGPRTAMDMQNEPYIEQCRFFNDFVVNLTAAPLQRSSRDCIRAIEFQSPSFNRDFRITDCPGARQLDGERMDQVRGSLHATAARTAGTDEHRFGEPPDYIVYFMQERGHLRDDLQLLHATGAVALNRLHPQPYVIYTTPGPATTAGLALHHNALRIAVSTLPQTNGIVQQQRVSFANLLIRHAMWASRGSARGDHSQPAAAITQGTHALEHHEFDSLPLRAPNVVAFLHRARKQQLQRQLLECLTSVMRVMISVRQKNSDTQGEGKAEGNMAPTTINNALRRAVKSLTQTTMEATVYPCLLQQHLGVEDLSQAYAKPKVGTCE